MKKVFKSYLSYGDTHEPMRRVHVQPILYKGERIGYLETIEPVNILAPLKEYHTFAITSDQLKVIKKKKSHWVVTSDWDRDDMFWIRTKSVETFIKYINEVIDLFGVDNRLSLAEGVANA